MEFFRADGIPDEANEWLQNYDQYIRRKVGPSYKYPLRLRDWELFKVAQYLPPEPGDYQILETGSFNTFFGAYIEDIAGQLVISDQFPYIRFTSLLQQLRIYKRHPLKASYRTWLGAIQKAAPKAEVRTVDLTNICYPDDTFDFITCISIIEHIPNYTLAVNEMLRVLKPDGLLLLTTDVTPEPRPYENGTKYLTIEEFKQAIAGGIDCSPEDEPDWSPQNWRYNQTFPVLNAFVALRKTELGDQLKPRLRDLRPKRVRTIAGDRRALPSEDVGAG